MNRLALIFAASIGLAGCPDDAPKADAPPPSDPALMQRILARQSARAVALKDWTLEGTAESRAGERVTFSLAFSQPGNLASRLDDGKAAVQVRYDGAALLVVDEKNDSAQRRDLSSATDEDKLLLVQQVFGRLFCEGWRPPLVSPTRTRAMMIEGRPALVVAIDDPLLKEERFFFDPATLDFAGRSTLDKKGAEVGALTVLAAEVDAGTGLSLPTRWTKKDGSGEFTITIAKRLVNKGVDAAAFSTNPPTGATVAP